MRLLELWRNRRGFLACCLLFTLFYMSHGCYYPYISLYYQQIGLDMGQIGVITAIGPFLAMAMQTLWGRLADRRGRKRVLCATLLLSGLCLQLFFLNHSFAYTLLVAGLYVACSTASQPLTDTIALDYCSASGFRFAPIRLCGTIGFGVMPLLVGGLMASRITNIFPLYGLFCLLAALACLATPGSAPAVQAKAARGAFGQGVIGRMLRDPAVQFVLLLNFAVNLCMSTTSFLPVYASNMGVDTDLTGKLNTISAACEIPFFLLIDWVLRRVRREHAMLATLLFTCLRMGLAYAAGLFPGCGFLLLGLSQTLHCVSYIMLYYCSAQFIHSHVEEGVRATAQTLVAMIAQGFARAVGSIAVGAVGDALGLQNAYLLLAVCVVLLSPPVFWLYRRAKAGTAPAQAAKG